MADKFTLSGFGRRSRGKMVVLPGPRGNPPVNTVAPNVTGTLSLGNVCSCSTGTWSNSPGTFLYQWQRNAADIPGAVNPTYTITNSDLATTVRCLVSAYNNDGAGYAYSNNVGAAGGGGGPPATGALVGMELSENLYWRQTNLFQDQFKQRSQYQWRDSLFGGSIHDMTASHHDGDYWPNVLPVGGAYWLMIVTEQLTAGRQYEITWTGTLTDIQVQGPVTVTLTDIPNKKVQYTCTDTVPATAVISIYYTFTPPSYPKDFKVLPRGVGVTTFESRAIGDLTAASTAGAPIRTIKAHASVERNGRFASGDRLPNTAANRTKLTSGDWYFGDGIPVEAQVAVANACGRDLYFNFPWNAADDWIVAVCTYIRDNLVGTCYFEVSNEIWNGGYDVRYQCQYEGDMSNSGVGWTGATYGPAAVFTGSISGTTLTVTAVSSGSIPHDGSATCYGVGIAEQSLGLYITNQLTGSSGSTGTYTLSHSLSVASQTMRAGTFNANLGRHGERHKQIMAVVDTVYTTAPQQAKRKRVLASQLTGTTQLQLTMDFNQGSPAGTVKDFVDVLAVAPYFSATTAPYTNPAQVITAGAQINAFFAAVPLDIDYALQIAQDVQDLATSYGKAFMTYEGGQSYIYSDQGTMTRVQTDSQMYDMYIFYLQEFERRCGKNSPIQLFVNCSAQAAGDAFGHKAWEGQTLNKANTPKFQAVMDYITGTRQPNALIGTLTGTVADANSTSIGTLTRFVPGSTVTIQSISGGTNVGLLACSATTGRTVNVTVANNTYMPSSGSYTVTFRETDSRFPAPGYRDTALTYTLNASVANDNFNDNSKGAIWGTDGVAMISYGPMAATGVTVNEQNQRLEFQYTTTTANRGNCRPLTNTTDMTDGHRVFWKSITLSGTGGDGMAFGTPNNDVVLLQRDAAGFTIYHNNATTGPVVYANLGGNGAASLASYPWLSVRKSGANLLVDGYGGANNPPQSGDWVNLLSISWPSYLNGNITVGPQTNQNFGVGLNAQYILDGFCTGT